MEVLQGLREGAAEGLALAGAGLDLGAGGAFGGALALEALHDEGADLARGALGPGLDGQLLAA